MSKKTTYFIGILATLILGFLLHWYVCCDEHCAENPIEKTKQTNANAATPFKFEDGNTAIRSNDNFNFYFSGHAIMQPISEDLLSCVNEMIRHLEKNKSKTLNILGLYNESEENLSSFDNLGLARAESIKRYLVEQGLNAAQVSTNSKKDNSLTPNQEGVLNGPYAFSVEVLEGSNNLEAMKASIMEDPVLLNFAPERYRTDLNAKQRKKLEALAAYLNASDDARCTIVGHADSVKSEQLNMVLGKNRAEFTKTILLKYDIDPTKIKTTSKGETQPIASNKTAKGKDQKGGAQKKPTASSTASTYAFNSALAKTVFGKTVKENDLTIVEGIGPKIQQLFHKNNIKTWKSLSNCSVAKCQNILDDAGEAYRIHNPGTWPKQARMA